jgi:excisionase family DNA binding protein
LVLMAAMLTAKEVQALLQVDRSTIYRMAEAGHLPAVKVGKQWRFPADLVENWLKAQTAAPLHPGVNTSSSDFASLLPLDCIQLIQDAFAETLGVMLLVTDLQGQPITKESNPCSLYYLLVETDNGRAICCEKWKELGQVPTLEPRFTPGFGGLLCARALVRIGNELKAMVIASGVAPQDWPPPPHDTAQLARSLKVAPDKLQSAFDAVFLLTPDEQKRVLVTIQRIADILAHIGHERLSLLDRLAQIAKLSAV